MSIFGRAGLPSNLYETLLQLLAADGVKRPRVLAWAPLVGEGAIVALVDRFVVLADEQSLQVGWHEVYTGAWEGTENAVRWSTLAAPRRDRRVWVSQPGKFPEVFRERIEQSIVLQQVVDLDDAGHTAVVSARRQLGTADNQVEWMVLPGRNTSFAQPLLQAKAQSVLTRFRQEWSF